MTSPYICSWHAAQVDQWRCFGRALIQAGPTYRKTAPGDEQEKIAALAKYGATIAITRSAARMNNVVAVMVSAETRKIYSFVVRKDTTAVESSLLRFLIGWEAALKMFHWLERLIWGVDRRDPYMDTLKQIKAVKPGNRKKATGGWRFFMLRRRRAAAATHNTGK